MAALEWSPGATSAYRAVPPGPCAGATVRAGDPKAARAPRTGVAPTDAIGEESGWHEGHRRHDLREGVSGAKRGMGDRDLDYH